MDGKIIAYCPHCNDERYFYYKKYTVRCEQCGIKMDRHNGHFLFNFNDLFMEWKLDQVKALSREILHKKLELVKLEKKLKSYSLKTQPAPRYDDVYFEGVKALDKL